MPENDLIQISISKFIPAPKWKIIRLLTKVWEFPEYIPAIKEARVLSKSPHKITTKWRVQAGEVPITWTEEDHLTLKDDSISFKAIEGDLAEFYGKWKFQSDFHGTKVTVDVNLKVGIPAIKPFADEYIKGLLSKNFEEILESVERRLISIRYASYKRGDKDKIAGFGVIGHFYNYYHLERSLKMLNPDFKMPSKEFIGGLFNITPSFKMFDLVEFRSKNGDTTKGCFIVATFIPDMVEKDVWTIFSKVVKACKIAEKHGVGVVTLGGFASIVGERIGQAIANEVDVPVTTGNTFTAAMAIDGILKAAQVLNINIPKAKAAVIGGTGDIGSACARVLTDQVSQLTITGRTKINLRRLRIELSKKRKAKIIATTDNESAIKDADIIIAAASVTASIININWFKPGSIICDVGYPKNVSYMPTTRKDILIFSGGLAKSPTPISFPVDTGLPAADVLYGCFAEAIILSLEKRYESFSFGRGNISTGKVEEIRALGKKHGFEVSDFYWGNRLVDQETLEKIKEAI